MRRGKEIKSGQKNLTKNFEKNMLTKFFPSNFLDEISSLNFLILMIFGNFPATLCRLQCLCVYVQLSLWILVRIKNGNIIRPSVPLWPAQMGQQPVSGGLIVCWRISGLAPLFYSTIIWLSGDGKHIMSPGQTHPLMNVYTVGVYMRRRKRESN